MILTSIELEQIIKEEIEAVLSEAEHGPFKKIGQDIKRTSQKVGQDIKQAVGKLKRKPAEPVARDPRETDEGCSPRLPDGFGVNPETGDYEFRKTFTFDSHESMDRWEQLDRESYRYGFQDHLRKHLRKIGKLKDNERGSIDFRAYDKCANNTTGVITLQAKATWNAQRDQTAADLAQRMNERT